MFIRAIKATSWLSELCCTHCLVFTRQQTTQFFLLFTAKPEVGSVEVEPFAHILSLVKPDSWLGFADFAHGGFAPSAALFAVVFSGVGSYLVRVGSWRKPTTTARLRLRRPFVEIFRVPSARRAGRRLWIYRWSIRRCRTRGWHWHSHWMWLCL